ncbi:MAG: tetratricopeptide repeat protein [Candidatus Binataceae bacterium]
MAAYAMLIVLLALVLAPGGFLAFADQPPAVAAPAVSPQDEALARPLAAEGISAYERGDYAAAVDSLTHAQALVPSNSSIALYLGLAYLKQGNPRGAIAAWQTYGKLKPSTTAETRNNLRDKVNGYVTLLQRRQDLDQARQEVAREREIGPGNPNTVAITYYRNLGSPDLGPLQKGLTALLIADVSKVPGIEVVERERLQALLDEMKLGTSGLATPGTAARTGRLLGAGRVATGSYVNPTTGEMRIDSVLAQTSSARVVGSQAANGKVIHFYDVEKQLAAQILSDLGYDKARLQAAGVYTRVAQPQTTSYPAFVAFSRGLDAKDRQDYADARSLFQQALTYDPNFEAARRELLHTPLSALSVAEIETSVGAGAPSVPAVMVALGGSAELKIPPAPPVLPVVSPPVCPPCPVVRVPPAPPLMRPPRG